jgi:hypothetical protein
MHAAVARVVADRDALREAKRDRVGHRAELAGAQRLRRDARGLGDHDELGALDEDDQRDVGIGGGAQRVAVHRLARQLDGIADRDAIALLRALAVDGRAGVEQRGSCRRPAAGKKARAPSIRRRRRS